MNNESAVGSAPAIFSACTFRSSGWGCRSLVTILYFAMPAIVMNIGDLGASMSSNCSNLNLKPMDESRFTPIRGAHAVDEAIALSSRSCGGRFARG